MAGKAEKGSKKGWIHCVAIIEVLGKPADYINEVVRGVVDAIKKDAEHIEILKDTYAEPKPVKSLFSTFVEIEFLIKNMNVLESLIFSYMPSSIEILDPPEMKISLNDANLLFNDFSARLHEYDTQAKKLKMTNILIMERIKELEAKLKADKKEPEKEEKEKENSSEEEKKDSSEDDEKR